MSLDPTCDLGRGPGQSSGCYETLRITTQPNADAAATVVPSAAQPICESFHTFPWGSQTRLLVCTNPDCAKVSAEHEQRRPAASPGTQT
jgi:hypothetical protein